MKNAKIISVLLVILSIGIISLAITIEGNQSFNTKKEDTIVKIDEFDTKNIAESNIIVKQVSNMEEVYNNELKLLEVDMEVTPVSVPPRIEVYDGMTLEELAIKIDRNLGSDYIAGKGYLIASQCLQLGVDPYVATAIMLHETGCNAKCSNLTRYCNNVGGIKGSPGCNGGSYKSYATLDEGIIGFVNNLHKNYYSKGLTTIDSIGPKYAESTTWVSKIYSYVNKIRAN